MITRSQLWQDIVAGDFLTEAKALIYRDAGENSIPYEYTEIDAPEITRGFAQHSLSVGNCVSASLKLSLIPAETIQRAALVEIQARVTDGIQTSEWLPMGSFYISRRETDPITGKVILTCYDAMLKAGAYNDDWSDTLEVEIPAAVSAIAAKIGVTVDDRTTAIIGTTTATVAVAGKTMRQVLEMIASGYIGNFVITHDNKLRLVPLLGAGTAETVKAVLGSAEKGKDDTITGVRMRAGVHSYMAGTDTGSVVDCGEVSFASQDFVDAQATAVLNAIYRPFTLARAIADPCLEVGDVISWGTDVHGVAVQEKATFLPMYNVDLQAPYDGEIEEEYPYLSTEDKIEVLKDDIASVADEAEANLDARTQALLRMQELAANGLGLYGSSAVSANGTLISYWHDKPVRADSKIVYMLNSEGFFISQDGGATWVAGFNADGNAVLNVLSIIGLNAEWIKTGQISDVTGTSFWNLETGDFATKYMRYVAGEGLHISADDGSELLLASDGTYLIQGGVVGATFEYDKMKADNVEVEKGLIVGGFKFFPRSNGNMAIVYTG